MMGDVNLWGHERRRTLAEKLQAFHQDSQTVTDQIQSLPNADLLKCYIDLKYVLKLITSKICDVREIENIQ